MEGETSKQTSSPHRLITEGDVKNVLLADKGKNAQIISWKVRDFTKPGDNYASVVSSVPVKYSKNHQEHETVYVVKLNPCRTMKASDSVANMIFHKEAKFYLDLVPELNSVLEAIGEDHLRLPQCFHGNLEFGKEQIYFEDLRPKGFEMLDRNTGMDTAHVTLVLKELARLHAASHLLQVKTPDDPVETRHDFLLKDWEYLMKISKDDILGCMENYLTTASALLNKVGNYGKAISWVESLRPQLENILTKSKKSDIVEVICHGDCWNNNMLFRYDDEGNPVEVMMLDLQGCRKASLATDLNYLFYTSLEGDVRRKYLNSFLSTYYSSFKCILDAGGLAMFFTEEDLLEEFRDKNVLGALYGMSIIPVILMDPNDVPDMSAENTSRQQLLKEVRNRAMDMLDSKPLIKLRFLSIFDEFMETGLIP